jgi:hypothetical protein
MMSEHAAGFWPPIDPLPRSRGRSLLVGLMIGALLGTAVTVAADRQVHRTAALAAAERATIEFDARPLPREWRGARPDLDLEHMFRQTR